jgi:integrase
MARNVEEIVLQARDEASGLINNVAGQLGGMGTALTRLAQTAGPVGLGLATVAAGAAGIVVVGAKLADTVEQLDLLSARTGVSIERLQVFQRTIEEAGGSPESLTQALSFLNRAIATNDPLLTKLHINGMGVFDTFMALSNVFAQSSDDAKKTEIAYQLLGRGAGDLVGLLPQLGSAFADMDAKMRATGGLIEGEVAVKARLLDRDLDTLSRNWSGSLTRIQAATVPWALEIVQQFNDVWDAVSGKKTTSNVGDVDEQISRTQGRIKRLEETAAGIQPSSPFDNAAFARLANINALLDEQKKKVQSLLQVRKQFESADEDARRLREIHGDTGKRTDSLSGVAIGQEDSAAKARAERLKELARILEGTGLRANEVAAALDRIEDKKKRAQIVETLTLGPHPGKELEDFNAELDRTAALLGVTKERMFELIAANQERKLAEEEKAIREEFFPQPKGTFGPELPPGGLPETARDVGEGWAKTLDEITNAAGLLDSTFNALFSGLQSGFSRVFADILSGTATFGSVLKTLFGSIVDAIISELSRIAAAEVLKFVGGVLGIPGFGGGASVTTSSTSATFSGSGVAALGPSNEDRALNQRVGDLERGQGATYVTVQSYDLRDGLRELSSGSLGRARTKIAVVGGY